MQNGPGENPDVNACRSVDNCSRVTPNNGHVSSERWGIVLAGGDGMRLRPLTRFICGDERPKQFCRLLGELSLVQEAGQRAERAIARDQIFYSVTRAHERYYAQELARNARRVVQPGNKGTAAAILSSLLSVSQCAPDAIVAILPSDHYFSHEREFDSTLESAFMLAGKQSGSIVLIGAHPHGPEVEYGWIEVGDSLPGVQEAFAVRDFREKPSRSTAEWLFQKGSLWNTFIMVGRVRAFLSLAAEAVPSLVTTLQAANISSPDGREIRIPDEVYSRIAPVDFSRQVLAMGTSRLITLQLGATEWNDLGDPDRVFSTVLASGRQLPAWFARWRHEDVMRSESGAHAAIA